MPLTNHGLRPRWAWLFAFILCVANLPLHRPISDVCDALFRRLGRSGYEYLMLFGICGISAFGAWVLWRGGGRPRNVVSPPVITLAALTVAAQQLLLVSNVELIHFPQFGLLAALLLAAGLNPEAAWLMASGAGVLDEVYQHLVIYAGVPGTYLDFNDMVLNAIGAAWPVVLVSLGGISRAPGRTGNGAGWRVWVSLAILAGLPLLYWLDPPSLHPFVVQARTGRAYRVLTAVESVLAVAVVWLIVWRSAGLYRESKAQRRKSKAVGKNLRTSEGSASLIVILVGCLGGCSATPPAPTPPPPASKPFLITFWCGPPLERFDDGRAAEIAAAGFTVVGPPCEGEFSPELNRRALDLAQKHGLEVWVMDRRIGQYRPRPQWEAPLVEGVADYRDHPAVSGYFVVDEPTADRFDDLAPVVRKLHAEDPERLAYINLLPDYIAPEHLQAESYRDYVESFLTKVQPRLLSYDHYPFKKDNVDRPSFFENLGTISELARKYDLPFLLIVQAMPHGPYRDLTEAELSWQVFHALAYGASGISYFAYWTPVDVRGAKQMKFRYGLIEQGKPTLHYFQAQRINRQVASFAGQLEGMRSLHVADSLGDIAPSVDFGPLRGISGGPVTIGFFAGADDDPLLALLVNRDYRYAVDVELRLHGDSALPARFDSERGRWDPIWSPAVELPPGGAVLLRW